MTALSPTTTTMILMSMIHLLMLFSTLKVLTDSLAAETIREASLISHQSQNLITPPQTPETKRKRAFLDMETSGFTPNKVGRFLKDVVIQPASQFESLGDTLVSREMVPLYQRFLADNGMNDFSEEKMLGHCGRAVHVAKLFKLRVTGNSAVKPRTLELLFAHDKRSLFSILNLILSAISAVSKDVGKEMERFLSQYPVTTSIDCVSLNISSRLFAMKLFSEQTVEAPVNLAAMFIFIHQLIWEDLAVDDHALMKVPDRASQSIKEDVNSDIARLCTIAMQKSPPYTKRDASDFKVCSLHANTNK